MFAVLALDADNESAMLDATIVQAHQHSAGAKGGGSQRGDWSQQREITERIHARTDAFGNPTGFHLTPGQASDLEGADVLLPDLAAEALLADKAYDAQARVIDPLEAVGQQVVIPPRCNRKVQREYDRVSSCLIDDTP